MIPQFINKSKVPHKPGVYIYKNKPGRVIYVGKAIDLYHRVASYFSQSSHDTKTKALVEEIASVETIIVESELEALILEANLIKKYLPRFNIRLVDDKDYLYIKITKAAFPRVVTARKKDLKGSLKYFGPYPSSRTVKETLKILRRVFRWESPNSKIPNDHSRSATSKPHQEWKFKACFYYHLDLCSGVCVGAISKVDYRKNIFRLIKLLEGKKEGLVKEMVKEMDRYSKQQRYEDAAAIKKLLAGIGYLTQTNRTKSYLENPNFLEDEKQKALLELQLVLNLEKIPERIECYDISNIQGHQSTGSMVVMTNGEIDKGEYRKFKIKITGKPNDYVMHQEMMSRRLNHPEWSKPDLIIIDGGLGQVHAVEPIIHNLYPTLPLYGLAKRMEWLYAPDGTVIKLPKSNRASRLLQKIRDESHRFAITYHRKLRSRAFLPAS